MASLKILIRMAQPDGKEPKERGVERRREMPLDVVAAIAANVGVDDAFLIMFLPGESAFFHLTWCLHGKE